MKKILFLLLLVILSCKSEPEKKIENNSNELVQLEQSLDALFNEHIKEYEPGAAVLVAHDGKMILGKGYGLRDVEEKLPLTETSNMRMASVSKQFTALCILTLVDQGKLKLSDSAVNYLPHPIFEGIIIEQLVNHTSGLPDYYEHFDENWDQTNILENQEVLDWLATSPERVFEPGTDWEYSNTAYLMLPLIVEKVSGMEFSAYAKKYVFEKAGMKQTNYYNLAHPIDIPERAFCYELDSVRKVEQVDGFFMNGVMGDGAVYTSLSDYFQYDQALRNRSILSDSLHTKIFTPSSSFENDNGKTIKYAMGWGVTDSTATHSGGWYGTNTFVKRHLNKPLTYTVFMNRNTMNNKLLKTTDSLVNVYAEAKKDDSNEEN